jgi:hypothetical protein
MPNVSHDLRKRYDRSINAEILETHVEEVNGAGYADINSDLVHHLIAWIPVDLGGGLRTTFYHGNRNEHVQSYVQKDGNVNIGSEEWAGQRVVVLVLDGTLDDQPEN